MATEAAHLGITKAARAPTLAFQPVRATPPSALTADGVFFFLVHLTLSPQSLHWPPGKDSHPCQLSYLMKGTPGRGTVGFEFLFYFPEAGTGKPLGAAGGSLQPLPAAALQSLCLWPRELGPHCFTSPPRPTHPPWAISAAPWLQLSPFPTLHSPCI